MKTIKIIFSSKVDSFGTKTIVFLAKEGNIYIASRDEGNWSDLDLGKKVYPDREVTDGNCTLR
jgi:hypothetical protein